MLVGFIGSPCSGKTTTAAKLFAELKECGQPTEYIAERARWHIANKKFNLKIGLEKGEFVLDDQDQVCIALAQKDAETVMNDSGNVIVITDSCVLNSFLYMSPWMRAHDYTQHMVQEATKQYDVIFICAPVARPAGADPNRVHDEAASQEIHDSIEPLLKPFLEGKEVHHLTGNTQTRVTTAFGAVMNKFVGM